MTNTSNHEAWALTTGTLITYKGETCEIDDVMEAVGGQITWRLVDTAGDDFEVTVDRHQRVEVRS